MFREVYIFLPIHSVTAAHHLSSLGQVGSLSTERASFCDYFRMTPNVPLKDVPSLAEPGSVPLSLEAHPHIRRPKMNLSL